MTTTMMMMMMLVTMTMTTTTMMMMMMLVDVVMLSGDILENYCYSDDLVNVARVLFAVAVMLTYPIECFVTREVSGSTQKDLRDRRRRRWNCQ